MNHRQEWIHDRIATVERVYREAKEDGVDVGAYLRGYFRYWNFSFNYPVSEWQ